MAEHYVTVADSGPRVRDNRADWAPAPDDDCVACTRRFRRSIIAGFGGPPAFDFTERHMHQHIERMVA